jgi:dienelactone hydrolase
MIPAAAGNGVAERPFRPPAPAGGDVTTRIGIRDDLLSAQTLRAMGTAPYGGADIGECLAAARRARGTDLGSWHDAWTAAGTAAGELAERELAAGRDESARLAFWRASSYFRTAGTMLLAAPADPRLVRSNTRQTEAFRRGAALLELPPELVQIPYEGAALPGYFFRARADSQPRATVILTGGYDGTAEELYFLSGAAALARGYHVLAFDGPGQGAALLQQGLVMRPDWEAVITPVVDDLIARPGVDAGRIVLHGLSLGGNLAPRAASGEHRLAACIADCGSFDPYATALERLPGPLSGGLADAAAGRPSRRTALLRRSLQALQARPTAGWSLRRGQLVHGVPGPLDYLLDLRAYSLAERAGRITCPTFVANAEGDDISASAPRLAAALTCESKFVTFTAAEGAGDHCEVGARTLFNARALGWLDDVLQRTAPPAAAVPAASPSPEADEAADGGASQAPGSRAGRRAR